MRGSRQGQQTTMQTLNAIGLETGTDKNSLGHAYLDVYDSLFSAMRAEPVRLLEIGVWEGASLSTWARYFTHPDARIVGLDIDLTRVRIPDDNRVTVAEGDASNPETLRAIVESMGGALDIVIDDGSHLIAQQRASLTHLRQYLRSGGVYIVEDLHTHFWERANPADAFQWLTDIAADIVGRGAERSNRTDATPNGDLLSLSFYQSLAVFRKR